MNASITLTQTNPDAPTFLTTCATLRYHSYITQARFEAVWTPHYPKQKLPFFMEPSIFYILRQQKYWVDVSLETGQFC